MKNQFESLQDWTREILEDIKKDLKNDHLHSDPLFYKAHFGNRPQNRLELKEIFNAYEKELLQNNEEISAFVVNRWVFKHGDLYRHFADRLSQINPDFEQIERLSESESQAVLAGAIESFGAIPTFLFAMLNGVVFPEPVLEGLRKLAEKEKQDIKKGETLDCEEKNIQKIIAAHAREVARLNAKLEGVQKKYTRDTEALKKQIRALQKNRAQAQ